MNEQHLIPHPTPALSRAITPYPQASRIHASLAKDHLLPKTWFERVISFIDVPQDLVSDRAVSLLKERSKVAETRCLLI